MPTVELIVITALLRSIKFCVLCAFAKWILGVWDALSCNSGYSTCDLFDQLVKHSHVFDPR